MSIVSFTAVLGTMAAAVAAVYITSYFVTYLEMQAEKQNRLFHDFKIYQAESQKMFQDQLDRLIDRLARADSTRNGAERDVAASEPLRHLAAHLERMRESGYHFGEQDSIVREARAFLRWVREKTPNPSPRETTKPSPPIW